MSFTHAVIKMQWTESVGGFTVLKEMNEKERLRLAAKMFHLAKRKQP